MLLLEKIEMVLLVASDMQIATLKDHQEPHLRQSSNLARKIQSFHDYGPSLFFHPDDLTDTSIETNLLSLASIHQEAFFGRTCGFQFCDSLKMPLTLCAVMLASYNDGYEAFSNKENSTSNSNLTSPSTPISTLNSFPNTNANSNSLSSSSSNPSVSNSSPVSNGNNGNVNQFSNIQNLFGQAAKTLFSSTKYAMDPELRGKKISSIMKNANIDFCKAFWQLVETPVVQVGSNIVTPTLAVNLVKRISLASPLRLPKVDCPNNDNDNNNNTKIEENQKEFVEVLPPVGSNSNDTVKIRILSYEMFQGMVN